MLKVFPASLTFRRAWRRLGRGLVEALRILLATGHCYRHRLSHRYFGSCRGPRKVRLGNPGLPSALAGCLCTPRLRFFLVVALNGFSFAAIALRRAHVDGSFVWIIEAGSHELIRVARLCLNFVDIAARTANVAVGRSVCSARSLAKLYLNTLTLGIRCGADCARMELMRVRSLKTHFLRIA